MRTRHPIPVGIALLAAVCLGLATACRILPLAPRTENEIESHEVRARQESRDSGSPKTSWAGPEGPEGEDEEEDEEEKRRNPPGLWFYVQRMGPDGTIPLRARAAAYEEVRLMEGGREAPRVEIDDARGEGGSSSPGGEEPGSSPGAGTEVAPADLETTGWTPAGPTLVGGRASALAADPNNPAHAWLGTAEGGVFMTNDGGISWTPVFDAQPNLSIGAIAAHPTNSSIVYVGTGEEAGGGYSYDGDGVYKTTDGGVTWRHMGLAEARRIGRIAIDPVHPERIFVAAGGGVFHRDSHRGVYRSLDGGATWQKVLYVADDSGAVDIVIDPSQPKRIYAAIWTRYSDPWRFTPGGIHSGIWQSTNGGTSWTRLTNGLPAASPTVGRIGLAIAPSSPQTVYAVYRDDPGFLMGVWKTTNAGASWFRVDDGSAGLSSMGYYFGPIRVEPTNPDVVYLLDMDLWKSTNGGVRFSIRTQKPHADQHDLLLLPGRAYLANDGGAYWTTSGADRWTKSEVLAISQIYDIGVARTNPQLRIAGLQDNGTQRTTTGSASSWSQVLGNDGTSCEIDPVDASRVYASYQAGNIFRSTNGGGTFTGAKNGIDPGEFRAWNTPIVHDPIHTQRLFTGTKRVYRSVDGASSWTAISPVLSLTSYAPHDHDHEEEDDSPPGWVKANNHGANRNNRRNHTVTPVLGVVTTIAASPLDTRILWAGTDDGYVSVSPNDGVSWNQVSPVAPGQWVTRVACDPFDAQTAYVSVSGYQTGVRLPHIFKTTSLGASWSDISGNLPQAPVNVIVPDPAAPGRLFAGTDVGVFMTQNGGATWFPLSTGMPHVVVMDLVLNHPARILFAATYGRSMYSYDLSHLNMTDTDGDGFPNASDCAPADGGAHASPADVVQRATANDDLVAWNPLDVQAGPGTGYDVLRGLVEELPLSPRPSDTCLATGLVAGSLADTTRPATGRSFFYLVRARNACGTGTWGTTSGGAPRVVTDCP